MVEILLSHYLRYPVECLTQENSKQVCRLFLLAVPFKLSAEDFLNFRYDLTIKGNYVHVYQVRSGYSNHYNIALG